MEIELERSSDENEENVLYIVSIVFTTDIKYI